MSVGESLAAVGEHDARLALGAAGLLRRFNDAGVLNAADVHVARRVGALCGETDPRVLLALALTTRAVRHGSVCLDPRTVGDPDDGLDTGLPWPDPADWWRGIAASPLVRDGILHHDHGLLYLDRYWRQEVQVADDLRRRLAQPPPPVDDDLLAAGLARVFPGASYAEQRAVAAQTARRRTTVLTGGPGTGKTTTVAGLLALLTEQAEATGARPRIALTAPTAKAAARLQEAVTEAAARLPGPDRDRLGGLEASTLHRLLGARPDNTTRFRHHRGNRLPHDLVVVDETSMVDLTMMARLLEALRDDTRLLLVGDADQLASVDAGAVLADLVAGLAADPATPVARLTRTHRFGGEIGQLAEAIRSGDADDVVAVLRGGGSAVELVEPADPAPVLRAGLLQAALVVRERAQAGDAEGAIAALDRHRLLVAHREGRYGVRHWNQQVEHWISHATGDPLYDNAYLGRPLLVTGNDYGVGVLNGDTGVVVRDEAGALRAAVATAAGVRPMAVNRLGSVQTMHAMTIHKSQGGQADDVTVLLPPEESRLLTRELLYTAVTRARHRVRLVGSEEAVRAAVARRVQRASGLRHRLAGRTALTPGGAGS